MPHISRRWIKRASIAGAGALATLAVVGAAGFFSSGTSIAADSPEQPSPAELWEPLTDRQLQEPLENVLPGTGLAPLAPHSGMTLAIPVLSDQYEYTNYGTNDCLTFDPDDGRDDGRRTAVTAPCDGTRNQMWTAEFGSSQAIVNLGTGLCLEGEASDLTVYLTACTGGPQQLWQWTGTGFRNSGNGLVLTQGQGKWPYLVAEEDAAQNYGAHAWWLVNAR